MGKEARMEGEMGEEARMGGGAERGGGGDEDEGRGANGAAAAAPPEDDDEVGLSRRGVAPELPDFVRRVLEFVDRSNSSEAPEEMEDAEPKRHQEAPGGGGAGDGVAPGPPAEDAPRLGAVGDFDRPLAEENRMVLLPAAALPEPPARQLNALLGDANPHVSTLFPGCGDACGFLDIERNSSRGEVRRLFALATRSLHPDRLSNLSNEYRELFTRVIDACDTLRDPLKRALHDHHGDFGLSQFEELHQKIADNPSEEQFYHDLDLLPRATAQEIDASYYSLSEDERNQAAQAHRVLSNLLTRAAYDIGGIVDVGYVQDLEEEHADHVYWPEPGELRRPDRGPGQGCVVRPDSLENAPTNLWGSCPVDVDGAKVPRLFLLCNFVGELIVPGRHSIYVAEEQLWRDARQGDGPWTCWLINSILLTAGYAAISGGWDTVNMLPFHDVCEIVNGVNDCIVFQPHVTQIVSVLSKKAHGTTRHYVTVSINADASTIDVHMGRAHPPRRWDQELQTALKKTSLIPLDVEGVFKQAGGEGERRLTCVTDMGSQRWHIRSVIHHMPHADLTGPLAFYFAMSMLHTEGLSIADNPDADVELGLRTAVVNAHVGQFAACRDDLRVKKVIAVVDLNEPEVCCIFHEEIPEEEQFPMSCCGMYIFCLGCFENMREHRRNRWNWHRRGGFRMPCPNCRTSVDEIWMAGILERFGRWHQVESARCLPHLYRGTWAVWATVAPLGDQDQRLPSSAIVDKLLRKTCGASGDTPCITRASDGSSRSSTGNHARCLRIF